MEREISTGPDLENRFAIGGVIVDALSNQLIVDGAHASVEPRLMTVLVALAQAQGRPVRRHDLLALAWSEDGADEALTLAVSRLRRTLGPHAHLIATIPKVGYRLTAEVEPMPRAMTRAARKSMRWALIAATLFAGFWLGAYGAVWTHRDAFAHAPYAAQN